MEYRDEVYFKSNPEKEVPFSDAEYADRLRRIRDKMRQAKVDTLFLMSPDAMCYVSGYQNLWYQGHSPKQWPASSSIAINVDSDKFILFDSEREAILGRIFTCSTDTRYFPKTSMRDGHEFIASELKAKGWLTGTVGMEFRSHRPNRAISQRIEGLFRNGGAKDVVDATDLVREVRWIKSPAEVAVMEEAGRISNIGMAAARAAIRPGVTELEVYGEMVRAMAKAGGENAAQTQAALSGTKTNALHSLATRRVVKAGEPFLVDLMGVYKRYHVNQARTFFVGEPPKDVVAQTNKIAQSMKVFRDMLRPNLPVRELNKAILDYFKQDGLWQMRGWIGGYEMGICFMPDWVGNFVFDPLSEINADRLFEPGTAVNYENQFFMPRQIGQYFTIDTFLFKQDGARGLSDQPFELIVV
ncbi:MAG: M24 family metallopeptidase [Dongiaceae bacterium]